MIVAPSILAADFANLQKDVQMVNQSQAQWLHIDIMDGVFVPNISFGMPVLQAIAKHNTKILDVHLMIIDPDRYISTFKELGSDILTVHYEACTHLHRTLQKIKSEGMKTGVALNPHTPVSVLDRYISTFKELGSDILTVHYEACTHLHRTLQKIKSEGMKTGVALNPHTPVSVLEDVLQDIDVLLIMSVNPGFGGQSFIENTYKKVKQAKQMILQNNTSTLIEIDGGVTLNNAQQLIDAGADALVAGSFIFNSENPIETISKINSLKRQ